MTGRSRLRDVLELGKFKIVELWLGFFVAVALVGLRAVTDLHAAAILSSILMAGIAIIAATCSLDDVTGYRDGVDRANHSEGSRWGVQKPILEGRLSPSAALGFVRTLAVVASVGLMTSVALAWPVPGWMLVCFGGIIATALNYSYGLKLSYRGAGELVIFIGGAGTVLVPYGLVVGAFDPGSLFCAALIGAWHAQVVMFSNTKDAEGDRATGRMTIAASTSRRGNKIYIGTSFGLIWTAAATALILGWVSPWYGAALLPVVLMQAVQLRTGLLFEDWLGARRIGFWVLRLGILLLVVVVAAQSVVGS